MASKPRIGFIGLGLMGTGFTKRLVSCGYDVVGYDVAADRLAAAAGWGVRPAGSVAELAAAADQIHACVMTRDDLEAAVFGPDGAVAGLTPAGVTALVDHSTTDAGVTRGFAERLRDAAGIGWVDAPISGGPPAAEAGTLAIMAGGSAPDFDRVRPVLEDLGTVTRMGEVGAGQTTKMVNQTIVLNTYVVLAEALALAEAGGVDAAKIPAALGGGYAGSRLLERMYPRMVARDFAPAGYARQVLKDLGMLQDLAQDLAVPTPMSSQTTNLFRMLVGKGHGELDGIAILKLYDRNEQV